MDCGDAKSAKAQLRTHSHGCSFLPYTDKEWSEMSFIAEVIYHLFIKWESLNKRGIDYLTMKDEINLLTLAYIKSKKMKKNKKLFHLRSKIFWSFDHFFVRKFGIFKMHTFSCTIILLKSKKVSISNNSKMTWPNDCKVFYFCRVLNKIAERSSLQSKYSKLKPTSRDSKTKV